MDTGFIDAREACRLLGISQATLYAYVSRGLVESRPGADHRSRAYLRRDIERLLQRKRAGRGAARGAAQSLDRGLPVLETSISLIRPDGPYYRGHAAIAAARDGATLEDAARLLWDCGDDNPFALPFAPRWAARVAPIALARQVVMFLAATRHHRSQPQIGRALARDRSALFGVGLVQEIGQRHLRLHRTLRRSGLVVLGGDFVARLVRRMRREDATRDDAQREDEKAGTEHGTHDFVQFEAVHWPAFPEFCRRRPGVRPH